MLLGMLALIALVVKRISQLRDILTPSGAMAQVTVLEMLSMTSKKSSDLADEKT